MKRAASLLGPLLFAFALLGASEGCTHTGVNSTEGWNVIRTKHYQMYTSTTTLYSESLRGMEYHYAALSSSFFKKTDLGKVDVLFLEADDFASIFGYKRHFAALARVPGKGNIGKNGLLVVQPDDNSQAEALTHLFVNKSMPKAPLWFHEGFSSWARNVEYKEGGGQRVGCFGKPGMSDSQFMPLDQVLKLSWDEYEGAEARSWYKHTAHVLVDFMMHSEGGARMGAMNVFSGGFMAGKTTEELLPLAFADLKVDQLNTKVLEHGRELERETESAAKPRGLCPLQMPVPEENAPDLSDRTLEPAASADIAALLESLRKLPLRDDGYPAWYPEEIIARTESGGAAK